MTHTEGKIQHLRLVLEGLEVPIISAVVVSAENGPTRASIEIPPADEGLDIKPRTQVYLFKLNERRSRAYDLALESASADYEMGENYMGVRRIPRLELMNYKDYEAIFIGEVISFTYAGSSLSKTLVLQCVDHSSYWDTCYQTMVDYGPNGNFFMGGMQTFLGSKTNLFDSLGIGNDPTQFLADQLAIGTPRSPDLKGVEKGLLGGLIRVLEIVGGIPTHFAGVNDFFSIAELRVHLLQQISAPQHDKTPSNIMSYVAFKKFITNALSSGGGSWSFRDLVNLLNRYIYHVTIPNPSPRYQKGGDSKITIKGKGYMKDRDKVAKSYKFASALLKNLQEMLRTQNKLIKEGGDPKASLKGLYRELARKWNSNYAMAITHVRGLLDSLSLTPSYILSGKDLVTGTAKTLEGLSTNVDIVYSILIENKTIQKDVSQMIKDIKKFKSKFKFSRTPDKVLSSASRLHSQIFVPDLWFVPPPRCNIIFPSNKMQFNFGRMFLREASRLAMISSPIIGFQKLNDPLLNDYYFAPPLDLFKDIMKTTKNPFSNPTLLPHEIHTGIIPKIGYTSEIGRLVKSTYYKKLGKKSKAKLNYIRRLVNYNFFKYRFQSRQLIVTALPDSTVVAGFPGAVITSPAATITDKDGKELGTDEVLQYVADYRGHELQGLPRHLIGKIVSKELAISQDGGSMKLQFEFVRDHRGSDKAWAHSLNKTLEHDTPTKKMSSVSVTNTRDLSWKDAVKLGDFKEINFLRLVSPKADFGEGGEISWKKPSFIMGSASMGGVISDVRYWGSRSSEEGKKLIPFDEVVVDGRLNVIVEEDTLITNPAVKKERGFVVSKVQYTITEEKKVAYGQQVYGEPELKEIEELSLDDFIRPSWIDPKIYAKENITEQVYSPMLGSQAITDPMMVVTSKYGTGIPGEKKDTRDREADTLEIDGQQTIEQALDNLGIILAGIEKHHGYLGSFIDNYIDREIATMEDILGSENLEYLENMPGELPEPIKNEGSTEGFFSRSISLPMVEEGNLSGISEGVSIIRNASDSVTSRKKRSEKILIPGSSDPRPACRAAVKAYLDKLKYFRGKGVRG